MTLYPRIRIGDVVTIKGGKRLRPNEEFSSEPTQHPYIRARDVGEGIVKIQDAVYLPEDVANRLSRYRVTTGDVCITIVGANVGEMGIVPPNLDGANLTENCVRLTNNGKVTQGFLRYSLLGDDAQGQMKVLAGGAAQPKLGIYKIETVEIPLPSLPTQRKIASILSAYDDLIENNTRRIAILEEMAQAIYREWFAGFRFPGHENVKLVDSPLGQIPEGWEVVTLKDVCAEKKGIQTGPFGSQLHKSDYTDEGTPVVMPKDIVNARVSTKSIARVPEEVCDRLPRHRLEVGDTVCARRGEIGRNAFVTERESQWMCGTGCMRMRPRKTVISPRFLFDYLCTPDIVSLIAGKAAGAIMPNLNIGIMESVPVLLAPKSVQLSYECLALENLELVSTLVSKNHNLRTTRDLLLPKLISGKLDVKDLDIDTGLTAEALEEATA